jgi:S-adenosylmethionine uptake transporter
MAGGMFIFSAVDTQAKFLTDTLHPIQIVWARQLGLLLGAFLILGYYGRSVLLTGHMGLQIGRGALAATSATLFIVAVTYVPLADAVAISFVAPFMVTIIAAIALKEPVGMRRWIAVGLGFLGSLIVIRPGFGALHPAAFLVLIAAMAFALRQILSRFMSDTDRTVTTVCYTAFVGSAILTIPLPFVWEWPTTRLEVGLLVSIALMAAVAEFLVIKALEVAMAVVLAPVHYTLIIWGTMYGFLVFGEFPDGWTWAGTSLIVATGVYTLHRERVAKRMASD